MLSIIVSSYQVDYFEKFSKNVQETIGKKFLYEIIQIWNPGLKGICQAYNEGAEKASYDNLLFIHEDVLFLTLDWGEKLLNHLKDKQTGVVGLAGSDYVPNCPSTWHIEKKHMFSNILQYDKEKGIIEEKKSTKKEVFSLDGVFLAVKKEIFFLFGFNNQLKGFHGYDIDFTIRVAFEYKNYVIADIKLIHYSKGSFSKELVEARFIARYAYKIPTRQIIDKTVENKAFQIFINDMKKIKYKKITILYKAFPYINLKYLGIKNYFKILINLILS